ncbi:M28 family peptidase [Alteromonadaceae bacterium M269]|nr:M28 family peptidase [Alteromonadaceae bacterium M269]
MKKMHNTPLFLANTLLSATLLAACSSSSPTNTQSAKADFEQVYSQISGEELKDFTRTLSSDEFEGRQPTTAGERKTLDYLVSKFKSMGLEPGNGNSYLQPVDLVKIVADSDMTMRVGSQQLEYKENMVASTHREKERVDLKDSELVFVGYGVNAPEYNWNDYEGLDVKGKTVVILVNDPGFENPDSGKFQGKTMTYYGRWSYKYEEASRQGAEAALIVHETAPASYGWTVVANSWSGPQYGLVSEDGGQSRIAVEGWLSLDATKKAFAEAGLDFEQEKAKAIKGPYSKSMGITASVTVNSTIEKSKSHNVIATLPGTSAKDEHIIYSAHWDHLGTDPSKEGDQIYNGARDNATGMASLLSIANAFTKLEKRPARSLSFLVVTAEEQGLLGSKYYAEHPIYPLNKTVANINMDALNLLGKTKDVAVIGFGKSELETYLEKAVTRQGRYLAQEDRPEAGYYYRSDHFSFAKLGVPALYAKGGAIPVDEETAAYRKRANITDRGCYHQVCDEFRESWDFGGIVEDTQMYFEVGYDIAISDDWPKWLPTAEFKRQ